MFSYEDRLRAVQLFMHLNFNQIDEYVKTRRA